MPKHVTKHIDVLWPIVHHLADPKDIIKDKLNEFLITLYSGALSQKADFFRFTLRLVIVSAFHSLYFGI